jgi:signal transduction histidine kinase/HAMP domain-containing protein
MFKTLRTKLLIGLIPLLAIMVGLGLWAVAMLDHLGGRIDVILRENYESVLAAEGMKEALERMDSAALFANIGQDEVAREQFRDYQPMFRRNLEKEQRNVTLVAEGEQELADRLTALYARYLEQSDAFYALPAEPPGKRRDFYRFGLLPTFNAIKDTADRVLQINQANMKAEDRKAREAASRSKRVMLGALLGAAAMATAIALLLSRSILEPIRAVTRGARALSRGELDQVVPATTRDELGELAVAFNAMARTIREFQQAGTAKLLRAQRTAQATIDSFPDPVVVVDPNGAIERANPAARRALGVEPSPDGAIPWTPPPPLQTPLGEVLGCRADYLPTGLDSALCLRDDGQERFLLPRILAIKDDHNQPLGAAVVLSDVTKFRLVDQLKNDMVSTVSHELKTPLTSVQMAIHLLLEEAIGSLNPKQVELLLAARQDSDRLLAMVNDILDLTRIEQGRLKLDLKPVAPDELVSEAIQRFEGRFHDAGVGLGADVEPGLASVPVDRERISHVFDNLIGNALRHTGRGGEVRLSARAAEGAVRLRVQDTGEGIAAEALPHVFEKFYRVPGARHTGGAGLGLAIVREIVVAHGGQIEVTSQPGVGSTFTFTLPTSPREDARADRDGTPS